MSLILTGDEVILSVIYRETGILLPIFYNEVYRRYSK